MIRTYLISLLLVAAGTVCLIFGADMQTGALVYVSTFFFTFVVLRTGIIFNTVAGAVAGGIFAHTVYSWIARFESPTPYHLTIAVNVLVFGIVFAAATVMLRRYRDTGALSLFVFAIPFFIIRTIVHYLPAYAYAKAFITVVNIPTVFDWLIPYFGASVTDVLVLATGVLLARIATQITNNKLTRETVVIAVLFAIIASASLIIPAMTTRSDNARPSVKAALLQGNFNWNWDIRVQNTGQMLEYFVAESKRAAENGAKIIIWPEYAVPVDILHDHQPVAERLTRLSHDLDAVIVLGSMEITGPPRPNGKWNGYDLSLVFDPRKVLLEPYRAIFPFTDNVLSGDKPVIFDSTHARFPVISCFEVANHKFVGDYAKHDDPIDFYIGIANIQLFDGSAGHARIANHIRRIAAENGKYFIYVANTGPSTVYSRTGDVIATTQSGERATLIVDIPRIPDNTIYNKFGDLPLALLLLAPMAAVARSARHRTHRKNP